MDLILSEKRKTGIEIGSVRGDSKLGSVLSNLETLGKRQGYVEGESIVISWAAGHLFRKPMPEDIDPRYRLGNKLPDPLDYRLEDMLSRLYIVPAEGKTKAKQRKIIKSLLARKDIDRIFIATDADQEGEKIGRDFLTLAPNNMNIPIYRLWITGSFKSKNAVDKAFASAKLLSDVKYERLHDSARGRGATDYGSGMKLTKVAVEFYNKPFFMGRVKGFITGLIGGRLNEIKGFTSKPFWSLSAKMKDLKLTHHFHTEEDVVDAKGVTTTRKRKEENYFNKPEIESVARSIEADGKKLKIIHLETKETVTKMRPLPLSGSDFASAFMGMHKEVDNTQCDKILAYLREEGFTTYQGTNGRYFQKDDEGDVIESLATANSYFGSNAAFSNTVGVFNDKKASAQNHPPLSSTDKTPSAADIKKWESSGLPHVKDAYELIIKRILVWFLPDDKLETQKLTLQSSQGHLFELTGRKALSQGWRTLVGDEVTDTTFDVSGLSVGHSITVDALELHEGVTKCPPRYTVKTLLDVLLNVSGVIDKRIEDEQDPQKKAELRIEKKALRGVEGIGTDRTRGNIILELFKNKTIVENGKEKYLELTEHGWELYKVYPEKLKSFSVTAQWEIGLEAIRQGKISYDTFVNGIDKMIMDIWIPEIIGKVGKEVMAAPPRVAEKRDPLSTQKCPLCAGELYETKKVYGCVNRKYSKGITSGCKFGVIKDMSKTLGRKLEGEEDLVLFLKSTKDTPLKEDKHSIYYDENNKYFSSVIWSNSGEPRKGFFATNKTYRNNDTWFWNSYRGKKISEEQAKLLFRREEIVLTLKTKENTTYKVKLIVGKKADNGMLELKSELAGGGGGGKRKKNKLTRAPKPN